MLSLTTDRWHYIRNGDGVEELFEYVIDPDEAVDLASTDRGVEILVDLRSIVSTMTRPAAVARAVPTRTPQR